ncbi:apoptosis regulator BAX [Syngnathus scovelli]|uniref:apoptosis regulator BAX n=1 Tax=Syngnathus scovelli TaxID=161590 RepID=UPI00210FB798|nr:apoptosis regulator BAX [Syngnathus scovelli]
MACEGNGISDERIGEALIKEVIEEELRNVPAEDIPPLTPLAVEIQSTQEKKLVTQLGKMIRIVGDKVKHDKEFQDAIDGLTYMDGSMWENFNKVANKVIEQGITWESIAVLFYVAGKLALKMVEAHLPQSVKNILVWTMDYFRVNLLGWIREHGGWINSFSELARTSMQNVGFNRQRYSTVLVFCSGVLIGSFFTWRMSRGS